MTHRTDACLCQGAVTICGPCGGRGVVVRQCQVAPGLQQGMSETCKACNGEGEVIEEEDICDACMGRKILVGVL
jgi:DnaJ-class molecular chaperone